MSDSIEKYTEMYEKKLEEKMISKGFGDVDSHDEEHVMKVVCKHFDLELTDTWDSNCDHYIYEESTADGYSVWVSTHDVNGNICVSENIFYYDNDLAAEFKQAIYDNDHGDVKIYLSMLHDGEYWVQDSINDIYIELVELYTDMCKDELTDEGFDEPKSLDMLNLIANNE
tara:strand:+ start:62 stop:571 length:510 start_codon:yes stop_codon:yes gene_type:complete